MEYESLTADSKSKLKRYALALAAVVGLSLLVTRAFGVNENCPAPGPTTGYGYGPSFGYGYDFGYGYGGPCPTPTPTATATATPATGTITLLDSDGNVTTQFEKGETGTAVLDALLSSTRYDIDFAQSPGVVIGSGTTDASGDDRIGFTIPTTATLGSATLTFLPNGSTTDSRVVLITIVAAAQATATPNATSTAVPSAVPVSTSIPSLPDTGAEIAAFLMTALALLGAGTVVTLVTRRRAVAAEVELPLVGRSARTLKTGLAATRFGSSSRTAGVRPE